MDLSLLTGKQPDEKKLTKTLADLTAQETEANQRLAGLKSDLEDELADVALGYEDAGLRAGPIRADIKVAEKHLTEIQAKAHEVSSALAAARAARETLERLQRERSVPRRAAEHQAAAEMVWQKSGELGDALRAMQATSEALAATIGTPEAQRLFSPPALMARIEATLLRRFDISLPDLPNMKDAYRPPVSFLPIPGYGTGRHPWVNRPLPDVEQETIDSVVRIYADPAEAQKARDRIAPEDGAETLHIVKAPETGLWRLIFGRRRGAGRAAPPPAAA